MKALGGMVLWLEGLLASLEVLGSIPALSTFFFSSRVMRWQIQKLKPANLQLIVVSTLRYNKYNLTLKNKDSNKSFLTKNHPNFRAMVVAQLVEWLLPTAEILGLNPVIRKIYSTNCTIKL